MATKQQRDLLRTILGESSVIKDAAVRRKAQRAAVQTAIVESGIGNPSGGDADSAGWRQERASLYSNPTNVKASARRFFEEFQDHYDPGEKSYEVAAQVQRPAAQYRGRYGDVAKRAEGILGQLGRTSSSSSSSSGDASSPRTVNIPSAVVRSDTDSGSALALIQAMSSQSQQKSAPSSMGVAPPAFAAGLGGGQTLSVQGGGGPGPKGPDISALLSAVAATEQGGTQQAGEGQTVTVGGAQEPAPAPSSSKGGGSSGIPFNTTKGGYQGSQTVATSLASIGKELGLKSTSEKRDNQNPYSGKGSDHEASKKNAYAYDLSNGNQPTPEMDRAAFRMMRALGFKDYKMGQPINTQQGVVNRGKYRIQVIYRGSGAAFGGDHKNHIHVGVERR